MYYLCSFNIFIRIYEPFIAIILIIVGAYLYKNNYSQSTLNGIGVEHITNQQSGGSADDLGFTNLDSASCQEFACLDEQNAEPSSFTNNWLTSRHSDKLFSERYGDFPLYDERRAYNMVYSTSENNTYRDILKTIQERSPVSDKYFSHINVNHIKCLISKLIKEKYNYNIDAQAQSDNEILIVMRSIYLQHAQNLPGYVDQQVAELNKNLLEIVPCSYKYSDGVNLSARPRSQLLPLERPINISSAGTRSNRSVTDLFI